MSAKKTSRTSPRRGSNKATSKSLATSAAKLLAYTNTPIPATKLQPIIEDFLDIGGSFVDQFTDQVTEQLADKIAEKMEGKLAEIRFVRG